MKNLFYLLLAIGTTLFGVTIEGYGYGTDKQESQKLALDDLSNNISVYVKSDYSSFVSGNEKEVSKKISSLISIKSELPILGARFEYNTHDKSVIASLSSEESLPLYEQKLSDYVKELKVLKNKIDRTSKAEEVYALCELALAVLQGYEKHEIVASILGYKRNESLELTQTQMKTKMIELAQNISSIELASNIFAKKFIQKNIYVYPLSVRGSNEITPFARVLRDSLSAKLLEAKTPAACEYKLVGTYEPSAKGLFVTYNLLDRQNRLQLATSLFINKNAYEGLDVEPKNLSFDEEIELGKTKLVSDLKVDLSIKNFGSKNVLLREGEDVELVVKSNRQAYIYIIGHTLHDNEKFSYLVELQSGEENERFVYTIGASDVNKPVLLPLVFSVSEPFGYESLQMFASTDIPKELPKCTMQDGYCLVSGTPEEVVTKTRGIKAKKQNVYRAEATLSFTTMAK